MDADPAWLRAYVTTAEELHFGRAALRLGTSQPQVSRQVRALEELLGVELFRRTPRQTELTDAGRLLLDDARHALAASERLLERAAAARHATGSRVSVAFLWSTLGGFVAPLISAAAERHPQIELSVAQIAHRELAGALRRGDHDMAISRPLFAETELTERLLRRETTMLAIRPDHPFATREALSLADLHREPLITLARELVPDAYDTLIRRAGERGIEITVVRHVRSAAEALALVSAGIGIYRVPLSAAAPFPGVVYRPLSDSQSRLVLIHPPLLRSAARAIAALAIELFSDTDSASDNAVAVLDSVPGGA